MFRKRGHLIGFIILVFVLLVLSISTIVAYQTGNGGLQTNSFDNVADLGESNSFTISGCGFAGTCAVSPNACVTGVGTSGGDTTTVTYTANTEQDDCIISVTADSYGSTAEAFDVEIDITDPGTIISGNPVTVTGSGMQTQNDPNDP